MTLQHFVVALLVAACMASAAWMLAPAGLRRRVAQAALALPWPGRIAARLQAAAAKASTTGCGGCARNPDVPAHLPSTPQPVTFHRRPPHRIMADADAGRAGKSH